MRCLDGDSHLGPGHTTVCTFPLHAPGMKCILPRTAVCVLQLAMERVRTLPFCSQPVSRGEGQSPASRRREKAGGSHAGEGGRAVSEEERGLRRKRERKKK